MTQPISQSEQSSPWTYQDAMDRLEQIVAGLERDQIGVDELSDQIREATVLLNKCRQKLTTIEEEVRVALTALEQVDSRAKNGAEG